MNVDINYRENALTAEDILLFQQKMSWTVDPKAQWEKSLSRSLLTVVATRDEEIIAMGILLGDAAIYWFITDVFVLTEYQGKGIGSEIVRRLLQHIEKNSISGTEISVCLMCAKGKEGFYEKFGFRCRPHEHEGAGMELEISIQ
jgi:GNAT superfamily N-acetyltransferase